MSRMNVYGYVPYCVLFGSSDVGRIRVRIRFSVLLESCYAHVVLLLYVVIVTPPLKVAYTLYSKQGTTL